MHPRLVLAPIRGITDATFRRVFAAHFPGFDAALAPFLVEDRGRKVRDRDVRAAAADWSNALPTTPQILARDAGSFLSIGRRLVEAGCPELNWNLGCPHPLVTQRGRGAGLLAFPESIDATLRQVLSALDVRLSVKLRLGLHKPEEILAVLDVFEGHDLHEVIVHPRTADQMYGGSTDVEAFAALAGRTRHTLVYNGDITTLAVWERLRARLPSVTRWMVGRGVLADPFLVSWMRGNPPAPGEELPRMQTFHDALLQEHGRAQAGPGHTLAKMQALWEYLPQSFDPKAKQVLKRIRKARTLSAYEYHVRALFAGPAIWTARPA
ncbi:MAG: tRNA-dihydrouridine synthase family protein [Polyangiaceae bacterium]|jgi:tRNA-dihydrouridine synthase|nr:tRNA-dihydrouridine synthase family protein [Polyangiaceae bacterium]